MAAIFGVERRLSHINDFATNKQMMVRAAITEEASAK
jgi:hypothetical protein